MKLIKNIFIVCALSIIGLHGSLDRAFADCNQDQAFNKMMAFNQAWMEYQQKYMALPQAKQTEQFEKFSSGAERSAKLSDRLATKDWNGVCSGYDALAKEFDLDLKTAAAKTVTMAELKKDGGRRGGKCSVADASKQMMEMHNRFEDKKANGEVSPQQQKAFYAAIEPLGPVVTQNPSQVCLQVSEISKQFGISN